jgi:hypothetical protein
MKTTHVALCGLIVAGVVCGALPAEVRAHSPGVSASIDQAIHSIRDPKATLAIRLKAIRELSVYAAQSPVPDGVAMPVVVSPCEADKAMRALLEAHRSDRERVVELSCRQVARLLATSGDLMQLSERDKGKTLLVIEHVSTVFENPYASETSRRLMLERFAATIAFVQNIFDRQPISSATAEVQAKLEDDRKWATERLAAAVAKLDRIVHPIDRPSRPSNGSSSLQVAANLLAAITENRALRVPKQPTAGQAAVSNNGAPVVVGGALGPIAASSMPSAAGEDGVAARMSGASATSEYDPKGRGAGQRGNYSRFPDTDSAIVIPSRRASLRDPYKGFKSGPISPIAKMPGTSAADQLNRSRGAVGATGAKPVAKPTQAKPAAPATPPADK